MAAELARDTRRTRVVSPQKSEGGEGNFDYFVDHFDLDSRSLLLGLAAEFGVEAEEFIFMLRRGGGQRTTSEVSEVYHISTQRSQVK